MIKSMLRFSLLGLAALGLAASPLCAAEKADKAVTPEVKKAEKAAPASKAERTGQAVPFRGSLKAKTDASITVQYRTKDVTLEINSETKLTKNGKPAILADAVVGEEVAGQYRKLDDKLIAKSARFGVKPEAPAKEKEKVKKAEKQTEMKPDATAPATK